MEASTTAKTDGTPRPSEAIAQLKDGTPYRVFETIKNATVELPDGSTHTGEVILSHGTVKANGKSDACWRVAEGPLRERATSKNPPVLFAGPTGRGGLNEPAPYALEQTVVRRSS